MRAPPVQFSFMPTITALGVPHLTLEPVSLFLQIIVAIFGGGAGLTAMATEGGGGGRAVVDARLHATRSTTRKDTKTRRWSRNMICPFFPCIKPFRPCRAGPCAQIASNSGAIVERGHSHFMAGRL